MSDIAYAPTPRASDGTFITGWQFRTVTATKEG